MVERVTSKPFTGSQCASWQRARGGRNSRFSFRRNAPAVVFTCSSLLAACGGQSETDPFELPADGNASPSGTDTGGLDPSTSAGGVGSGMSAPSGTMPTSPTATGSTTATSAGTGDTPPAVTDPQVDEVCPTAQLAEAPLRRLTRYEYRNTVRDLLHVDIDVTADFPPDEVVNGFSNNAQILTVGELHIEKYVLASEALAKEAVKNLDALAPCAAGRPERDCALDFAHSFGRRAYRRALVRNDEAALMVAYDAGATDGSHAEGIEVMIRAALQSPSFLYRLELTPGTDPTAQLIPLDPYELATRLAFSFWGVGPDDTLLDLAQQGQLTTKEQVAEQARRLLADPKARPALAEFYNQWLGTVKLATLTKSADMFPSFNPTVRDSMQAEINAFIDYVVGTGDHKLSTLLTAPVVFPTNATASLYGVDASGLGATPQMVMAPQGQGRAGILTQAGFLSVQAHPDQTSPVLRGKTIRTKFMCDPPPPPPDNVDITPPAPGEAATARDRLSLHLTAGSNCAGCHALMDPIGFAFENFDATGAWRASENGVTIDATGEITGSGPLAGTFHGVQELATRLAASDQVRDCVATQWFRFTAGRTENEGDACTLATVQEAFAKSDGDLVELMVGLTQTDAFLFRAQPKLEVTP